MVKLAELSFGEDGNLPWMQERVSSALWSNPAIVRAYLNWLANKLEFKAREDWCAMSLM